MSILLRANIAQVVAKLVARRQTRQDEIPELVRSVHLALTRLDGAPEPEKVEEEMPAASVAPRVIRPRRPRAVRPDAAAQALASEPVAAPPPRLLRRADVMHVPREGEAVAPSLQRAVALRGVVKWFDQRSRRGALRLPGCSDDVSVEPGLLDEMAISRLYKGQEVEATLGEETAPRVVRLTLPGGAWQVSATGGIVHNRHAKPVVVELKREALRRVAARAEAELLLGPSRAR